MTTNCYLCSQRFRVLLVLFMCCGGVSLAAQARLTHVWGFSFLSGAISGPAVRMPAYYPLFRYDTQPFLPPYVHSFIKVDRFVPNGGRILLGATCNLRYPLLIAGPYSALSLNAAPAFDLNDFNITSAFGTFSLPVFLSYDFGAGSGRKAWKNKGFHVGLGWQALAGGVFFSQQISGNTMQFWMQPVVRAGVRKINARGKLVFCDVYFGIPQLQKSFRAMHGISPYGKVITENGVQSLYLLPEEESPLPFDDIYAFVTNTGDLYLSPAQPIEPVFAERFEGPFYYDTFNTKFYFKLVFGFGKVR
ncbi:MAG: hypothetical protein IM638_06885 [Bacteroidetes bacterium]|nr:hypothetical protein [Bacteroidota bacterium]